MDSDLSELDLLDDGAGTGGRGSAAAIRRKAGGRLDNDQCFDQNYILKHDIGITMNAASCGRWPTDDRRRTRCYSW